jgi:hypothetical protein
MRPDGSLSIFGLALQSGLRRHWAGPNRSERSKTPGEEGRVKGYVIAMSRP